MTPTEAKRLVVVGTVGTGALSAIASYRREGSISPRIAIGVFAAGTILAVGAELVPAVAGGLAVLMLTTSAFVVGTDAWGGIANAVSPGAKTLSGPMPKSAGGVTTGATTGATLGAR